MGRTRSRSRRSSTSGKWPTHGPCSGDGVDRRERRAGSSPGASERGRAADVPPAAVGRPPLPPQQRSAVRQERALPAAGPLATPFCRCSQPSEPATTVGARQRPSERREGVGGVPRHVADGPRRREAPPRPLSRPPPGRSARRLPRPPAEASSGSGWSSAAAPAPARRATLCAGSAAVLSDASAHGRPRSTREAMRTPRQGASPPATLQAAGGARWTSVDS